MLHKAVEEGRGVVKKVNQIFNNFMYQLFNNFMYNDNVTFLRVLSSGKQFSNVSRTYLLRQLVPFSFFTNNIFFKMQAANSFW